MGSPGDPLLALIGFTVGVLVGLTGVGGGSLTTPALILLGYPPPIAVGTDLLYATLTRIAGVLLVGRRGRVHRRIALRLLAGSLPSVVLGGLILKYAPLEALSKPLTILLAIVLVGTGALSLARETLDLPITPTRKHAYLLGFTVALIVQFTSVGAGVLVGFALVNIVRLDPLEAVGTVLAYGLVLSTLSLANYLALGLLDPRAAFLLTLGGIPGVAVGVHAASRARPERLKKIINIIIVIVGIIILIKN